MKKIIALSLIMMSLLGSLTSTTFAGEGCKCKPCKCATCKCASN